jgi:Methyltransferase domain
MKLTRKLALPYRTGRQPLDRFRYTGPPPLAEQAMTELEKWFWANKGRTVHKLTHYLPLYEHYFGAYRNSKVRFLEIGVSRGGSLAMWRHFFGPEATIYGIDIDPACAAFDDETARVRIGSQDDPAFLRSVVQEMGGVDVVLDDGSHMAKHIRGSFETLFPLLSNHGTYMIEDLCASYWRSFSGFFWQQSFFQMIPAMIDDMHHWYHPYGQSIAASADHLVGLHIHDSMVVIDKAPMRAPISTQTGAEP